MKKYLLSVRHIKSHFSSCIDVLKLTTILMISLLLSNFIYKKENERKKSHTFMHYEEWNILDLSTSFMHKQIWFFVLVSPISPETCFLWILTLNTRCIHQFVSLANLQVWNFGWIECGSKVLHSNLYQLFYV